MNYAAIYSRLIARRQVRRALGYTEEHHIVPRCLGGSDAPENLVRLTPEEHYLAHQLLVKIYPKSRLLIHAVVLMAQRCSSNKAYGWLKRLRSIAGQPHSAETRAKISQGLRGHKHTAATLLKCSLSHRGKRFTAEQRARNSAAHVGKRKSPETKMRMSIAARLREASRRRSRENQPRP